MSEKTTEHKARLLLAKYGSFRQSMAILNITIETLRLKILFDGPEPKVLEDLREITEIAEYLRRLIQK